MDVFKEKARMTDNLLKTKLKVPAKRKRSWSCEKQGVKRKHIPGITIFCEWLRLGENNKWLTNLVRTWRALGRPARLVCGARSPGFSKWTRRRKCRTAALVNSAPIRLVGGLAWLTFAPTDAPAHHYTRTHTEKRLNNQPEILTIIHTFLDKRFPLRVLNFLKELPV